LSTMNGRLSVASICALAAGTRITIPWLMSTRLTSQRVCSLVRTTTMLGSWTSRK
jgi:hypothetical protein